MMQGACVENILDSVIMALRRDSNRKFIYVEMVANVSFLYCLMVMVNFVMQSVYMRLTPLDQVFFSLIVNRFPDWQNCVFDNIHLLRCRKGRQLVMFHNVIMQFM